MKTRDFSKKIELQNDGQLSLFFTGTGGAFSKDFFQTNFFIIKGKNHLLVDCGNLFPYALEHKFGTSMTEIRNLFVTHPHADHIGGIEELAFKSYYSKNPKINLICPKKLQKILWNNSLKGGLLYTDCKKVTLKDYFNVLEPKMIQKKPYELNHINFEGIDLKFFRTCHVTTKKGSFKNAQFSQGIIIDDRILFTADTQFNPEQLDWLCKNFNIEVIFHDCDPNGYAEDVHASYRQLKTLPEEIKSKMFLCHYNADINNIDFKKDGFAGFVHAGLYYDL